MMKKLFTLLLTAACFTASAQVEFPWNPDSNGDGEIGVDDLLGMLASFGESWSLPDPNEWASETLIGLLSFQDSLQQAVIDISQSQASLDSAISELEGLEEVLDYNTYLTTGQRCNVIMYDEASYYTAEIPNSCSFVVVKAQYGQTWPYYASDRPKIRLPEIGLFDGQRIHMHRHADYSDHVSFQIQHLVDGQWVVLTEIEEALGGGNSFSSSLGVKTFIWTSSGWTFTSGVNQVITSAP